MGRNGSVRGVNTFGTEHLFCDSVASTQGWGFLPGQDALVDGATGLLRCVSFLKHRQLSKQINKRRDQQAYSRSNVKMARLLHNLLLLTVGLTLKIRVMGYWTLIYGYCALCTGVALLKLGWNIILRPSTTFQWTVRETPPRVPEWHVLGNPLLCSNQGKRSVEYRRMVDSSLSKHLYLNMTLRFLMLRCCAFIFFFEIWTLHQIFVSELIPFWRNKWDACWVTKHKCR